MKATKIDWCDCTINPVIGCKNGCPYCYAERLNKRFGFIPDWNDPQFFPERLKQLNSKTPKTIFMDSMSDVGWWEREWGTKTFEAMSKNKQHAYIFLTKAHTYPCGLMEIWSSRNAEIPIYMRNLQYIFIGKSVTRQNEFSIMEHYDFLSIEPLLEPLDLSAIHHSLYIKQVIIGAETGNRKGKVIPKKEWVLDIVKHCDEVNIKVFMKESLRKIMGDDFRQDELLWQKYVKEQKQ